MNKKNEQRKMRSRICKVRMKLEDLIERVERENKRNVDQLCALSTLLSNLEGGTTETFDALSK